LAESLGLGYLSTGALLRENVENGTPLGNQAAPILARGEYLPDELMNPILGDWLARQNDQGWVLDGFPRSLPQAIFLGDWLEKHGRSIDAAVSLEVPFEELLKRTRDRVECPACRWTGQRSQLVSGQNCPSCGSPAGPRADDDETNFRSRYAEFSSLTGPVIEYFRNKRILHPIDATHPKEEVSRAILESLAIS
jgi:adenylate kinase